MRGLSIWLSPSDEINYYVSDVRFWMKIMPTSAMVD